MTNLISGKEAKMAWSSGERVEYYKKDRDEWFEIRGNTYVTVFDVMDRFRIKQRTITINGIEIPLPQKDVPKSGDDVFTLNFTRGGGYVGWKCLSSIHTFDEVWWKTECEIKQVVAALRTIFKTD